ncbi:hypothetical protein TIFTF001_001199 [Ficus carica]|uniref:Uncharacterized protein n=1 Tax=Ficus carica TaxID=3494 RepID=A0AA88CR17_FICCA|nr:hypothetical protein TIFTF001_001199 [Ficus carica]
MAVKSPSPKKTNHPLKLATLLDRHCRCHRHESTIIVASVLSDCERQLTTNHHEISRRVTICSHPTGTKFHGPRQIDDEEERNKQRVEREARCLGKIKID